VRIDENCLTLGDFSPPTDFCGISSWSKVLFFCPGSVANPVLLLVTSGKKVGEHRSNGETMDFVICVMFQLEFCTNEVGVTGIHHHGFSHERKATDSEKTSLRSIDRMHRQINLD
jgi:hypothetical protein